MSAISEEPELKTRRQRRTKGGLSCFNEFAKEYDAWFDREGKLIFFIVGRRCRVFLPTVRKPWLHLVVGRGGFAQALGIETGIDPSARLVMMARKRGINAFVSRGEERLFDAESFGTVFLIVTLCFLDWPLKVLKEARRILMPGGKIVLGLVLKESPWGKFYQQKKAEGHRFYKYATFYSFVEVAKLLEQIGFTTERTISALFQKPEEARYVEEPKEGYFPEAGFTVIVADKPVKDG